MSFAWFLYTIGIIVIAIAACTTSMTVWVLTNRKDCLVGAAGFLFYTLDVAVIFFDEYMREKPVMEEYFDTGLTHPVINIALRVAIVTCIWLWVRMRVHAKTEKRQVAAFAIGYALLSAIVAPVGERSGSLRTMLFWGLSDVLIIASILFAWWWYRHRATDTDRASLERSKTVFRVALFLALAMFVEDIYNILIADSSRITGMMLEFYWHLTERNIMENVLMVVCAGAMIKYNRDIMRVFSKHPMEAATDSGELRSGHRDLESRLLRFSDELGMSKREREVLRLIIEGKDTQNIASELYISKGTVKAHMHRIYTKAGVEHRKDLINAFWKH